MLMKIINFVRKREGIYLQLHPHFLGYKRATDQTNGPFTSANSFEIKSFILDQNSIDIE